MAELDPVEPLLWSRTNLTWLVAFEALAAVLVLSAWWRASGGTTLSEQLPWVNVGAGGLGLGLAGSIGWVFTGRRKVRQACAGLRPALEYIAGGGAGAATGPGTDLVSAAGMAHFHRSDCQLTRNKTVMTAGRDAHWRAGRKPCGMCEP